MQRLSISRPLIPCLLPHTLRPTDPCYPTPKRPSTDVTKASISATPGSVKPSVTPIGGAQRSPRMQATPPGSVNTVFKARNNVS